MLTQRRWSGVVSRTLDAYRHATGQETHSVAIDYETFVRVTMLEYSAPVAGGF